jgi:hypothetical protein
MLVIIIFSIVSLLVSKKMHNENGNMSSALAALFVITGPILGILVSNLIGCFVPSAQVEQSQDLYAYKDNDVYLSVKFKNTETKYEYVVQDEDSTKMKSFWSRDDAKIIEGDYKPHVVTYAREFKHDYYYLFANNILINGVLKHYEFYLPRENIQYLNK